MGLLAADATSLRHAAAGLQRNARCCVQSYDASNPAAAQLLSTEIPAPCCPHPTQPVPQLLVFYIFIALGFGLLYFTWKSNQK